MTAQLTIFRNDKRYSLGSRFSPCGRWFRNVFLHIACSMTGFVLAAQTPRRPWTGDKVCHHTTKVRKINRIPLSQVSTMRIVYWPQPSIEMLFLKDWRRTFWESVYRECDNIGHCPWNEPASVAGHSGLRRKNGFPFKSRALPTPNISSLVRRHSQFEPLWQAIFPASTAFSHAV